MKEINKPKILYRCDKKLCEKCSYDDTGCELTEDIDHAVNFTKDHHGHYIEKDHHGHYSMSIRSGRYPWGSKEDPYPYEEFLENMEKKNESL